LTTEFVPVDSDNMQANTDRIPTAAKDFACQAN